MIACILLAAGKSSRFGSPKALALFQGQPVIVRVINTLLDSNVDEIFIVLGASADLIKPLVLKHKRVHVVYNKDHIFGQTTSFQAGLRRLPADASGGQVLLYPVDYPDVQPATINRLTRKAMVTRQRILIPTFNERRGHPALFKTDLIPKFLSLNKNEGCHQISARHPDEILLLPVTDPGVRMTFNTPEELQRLEEFARHDPRRTPAD